MPTGPKARQTVIGSDTEEITRKLRKQIYSGILMPRERLLESRLAETYSVSRAVIRQVLMVLEKEGLLVLEPFKGASVADISLERIAENYEIIAMLNGFACKLAAERLTKEDFDRLQKNLKLQKKVGQGDIQEWQNLSTNFHRMINLNCGNNLLINLIRHHVRFTNYWFLVLSMPGRVQQNIEEHGEILKALMERKSELSASLMGKHIIGAGDYLRSSIQEILPAGVWSRTE